MEARAEAIAAGAAPEQVWLLEHPPIYTAGSSAKTPICSIPDFRFIAAGEADNTPITAPASASPM